MSNHIKAMLLLLGLYLAIVYLKLLIVFCRVYTVLQITKVDTEYNYYCLTRLSLPFCFKVTMLTCINMVILKNILLNI